MATRRQLANAIRALSMDAVQKAKSGHPGAPMGMADIAEVLWRDFLKHNPNNPKWVDRDRFVLSNGHGSMLIYSLLHLTGYDLSIEDLKQFRKDHKLKKISFGSEEELWDILKIKPGHVSPFCLLHDEDRKVHYYIDADYENNLIGIHPNQNDATVWLQGKELVKLIEEHGTIVEYITL